VSGARSTWIRTNDNVVIIVPNNEFINNSVTNWTANDPNVRLSLPVGVGYNSNPEQVRELLLQTAAAHPDVLADPPPDVIFTDYGDSSLNFTLRVWTSTRAHTPMILKSDLYFAVFKLFSEHGIELPFPQRDLHLRSSDIPLPFNPESKNYESGATCCSSARLKHPVSLNRLNLFLICRAFAASNTA
jgi:small-conductance mechanosensitive channel